MITKSDIIRMAMLQCDSMATNVYDLDYYRARVQHLDDYKPSRPVGKRSSSPAEGKVKTDRERVKDIQKQTNFKDLRK